MIDQITHASGVDVSRETMAKLEQFVELLLTESEQQNLIATSTIGSIWERHIIDSAQLCSLAPRQGKWLDIGAGAGLPGIVIAILTLQPILLVEPRRLRADFLKRCVAELELTHASVECSKVERVTGSFDIVTARAVASLDRLFGMAHHLSHAGTHWVLPKGRSGAKELADVRRSWQGEFRIERSATDPDGVIVLAERIRPKHGHRGGTIA
jgi:16S rRNA (guanine527-N7)-methyltransferase